MKRSSSRFASPRRVLLAGASLSLLIPAAALAQSETGEAERPEDRDVIIVTSSVLRTTTDEVTGAVEVVDQRHIEDNLAGSLADTIAHEPGVSTTYFGPAASRPVIRGLGADRVMVLVNGTGLIDASTASPDHAVQSEALEAEQIEILRGPAAIAYGGGAIGGVVNVIDGRIPHAPVDGLVDGRIYLGATSVDEGRTAAARARIGAGPFVFTAEVMNRTAEDYDIPGYAESELYRLLEEEEHHDDSRPAVALEEDDHEDEAIGTAENTWLDTQSASVGVSLVQDWGFVGIAYRSSESEYGVPGHAHHDEEDHHDDLLPSFAAAEAEEETVYIDMVQNRWDVRGEVDLPGGVPLDSVRFSLGMADYKHTEIEGGAVGTLFTNEGWEGRVEGRFEPVTLGAGTWEGAVGVQAFRRDFAALGDEAFVPASVTEDQGIFTVQRWDAGDWGLEGGLRLEQRDLSSVAGDRDFSTVSASGSVFFRPVRDQFFAVTLSRSERAPTDVELFADGPHPATSSYEVGDASLDVETALSLEFTARTPVFGGDLEAAVFRAEFDGFIGLFPTGAEIDELPVFEFRAVDATFTGFEARFERELGQLHGWDLSGELMAEYVRGEIDGGGNLPLIPPLSISGGLTASTDRHELHASLEWADVQNETAAFELKTQSHVLANARWTWQPFTERDVRFILEGRNLTDEEIRVHTSVLKDRLPLPGRNFRAAIVYSF
ncbi:MULTISPECIES: TonB-dependent receptor domain-containing protein [Hyphobacterium]|uniref:TonB-dependent receptor domain-containing protein n=1 Tax=Hyphobacterium vulgare TaxID=1736751 RepID=A0ABV6ZWI1_9PROT